MIKSASVITMMSPASTPNSIIAWLNRSQFTLAPILPVWCSTCWASFNDKLAPIARIRRAAEIAADNEEWD